MRTAKSSKIVLLLITMALSLIAFFVCTTGAHGVLAANPDDARDFFYSSTTVDFKNDGVSATVEEDGYLTVKSALALDNLGVEIKLNDAIKVLGVNVDTLPYLANGNVTEKDGVKKLVSIVEHALTITVNGNALAITFNGETANATLSGNLDVIFKVENNILYATVEGTEVYSDSEEYKVYDIDTCIAEKVEFKAIELAQGQTTAELLLVSVDQDVTDTSGKYKQNFKLNDAGEVEKLATPYGVISSDFVSADGKINLKSLYKNTLSIRGLSVLGELKNTNLRLAKTDANDNEIWFEKAENPKSVLFKNAGVKTINIETNKSDYENKVLRTLTINVYDEDTVAPVYDTSILSSSVYDAYKLAVEKASKIEDDNGNEEYVALGEDYEVPSLENFVSDNANSYGKLKATVHYKTPTDEGTSSDFTIPVESAGDYYFFVTFEDEDGNAMEEDDFFTVDENDENVITYGVYGDFVFSFHIEDDAIFDVDASKILGKGFVGQLYTATEFKIKASNYTATYKLFYNAKEKAEATDEGWVEIIPSAKLSSTYENDTFTTEDIENIDYNGKLTFTPDRVGTYKITCSIVSDSTTRAAEAEAVFSVEKVTTVKNYEPLETREILAIVFLSVGGVCLIGIVALIFVKPKEKTDAE